MSENQKKSPLCPPFKTKGGDGKEEQIAFVHPPVPHFPGAVDVPIPSLQRGATQAGGSLSCNELKKRKLIFNGRHLPYNPANVDNARSLRKNMTPEEKKLWNGFLRKHPLRFLRQRPVDHYILDFYCAKVRLGIELDGAQHYTEKGLKYDNTRSDILSRYNVAIIRFTNHSVREHFELVCLAINDKIRQLQLEKTATTSA